jgi:hypothetical protein
MVLNFLNLLLVQVDRNDLMPTFIKGLGHVKTEIPQADDAKAVCSFHTFLLLEF